MEGPSKAMEASPKATSRLVGGGGKGGKVKREIKYTAESKRVGKKETNTQEFLY